MASNTWDWYWIVQQPTCNQIQREDPVLYVERFVSVFTILRYPELWRRLFTWLRGPRAVTPRLHLLAPLPLFHLGHRFPLLFRVEFALQRCWIRWWARRLPGTIRILWVDNPLYECAVGRMGEDVSIYHVADEIGAFASSHARTVARLERRLLKKTDLVFAAAERLAEAKGRDHPRAYAVLSGIDPDVFAAPEPREQVAEIEAMPAPRVAYIGAFESWVDLELLVATAARLAHITFVCAGPVEIDVSRLRHLPNVHVLGSRPRESIPAILRRCSASLVPFRKNPLTERILPVKVFEALAAGIMPIATAFSMEVDALAAKGYGRVGRTVEEFIALVERAPREDTAAQRERLSAFGRLQTWPQRWRQMDGLIETFLSQRRGHIAS